MPDRRLQEISRVALRLACSYPATDLGNPPDPLDDLVYILLSGQTNEALYQATFGALKSAFPKWQGMANADLGKIEKIIAPGGLSQQKAGYLKAVLAHIERDCGKPSLDHLTALSDGEAEAYLTSLPGVGIKTARCVLLYALNREVFPADVNCLRIMERLGWLKWGGRRADLLANTAQDLIPPHLRRSLHIDLLQHGRSICTAKKPKCRACCLQDLCAFSGQRPKHRPSVVDLCCGAGGFSWGFMQAGYEVLLGVDTCPHGLATFAANLPGSKTLKLDITGKRVVEEIRKRIGGRNPKVVIAGPPCQGFSRAGPRNPEDPRNKVLHAVVRTAVKLRPEVIVIENVMFLRGPAFVRHLRKAIGVVRRAGYRVEYAVLNSESFGVPQTRQRIVFVAALAASRAPLLKILDTLSCRKAVPAMSVAAAFAGLADKGSPNGPFFNHDPMVHSERVVKKIKKIKPGEGPLSYRKLNPAQLAPTLVCGHRALPCHYAVPRTITAREAARLQGFWDEFRFLGPRSSQMLQVANAVPPRLALGVALAVYALLGSSRQKISNELLDNVLQRMSHRPC